MRIDVRKFLFVGVKKDIQPFFEKAQKMGFIHFISPPEGSFTEIPPEIQHISQAIKVLRGLPSVEQEETKNYDISPKISENILNLKTHLEKYTEAKRVIKLEKARVAIFGNFSLEDIAYIEREGNCKVQFFCGKQGIVEDMEEVPGIFYVGTENGLDYFVSVNSEASGYDRLIEIHIDKPYGTLVAEEHQIDRNIRETTQEIKSFAKYKQFLHDALIVRLNKYHLHSAQAYAGDEMDGSLFAIEAWVSESNLKELDKLVTEENVHCEEIAIEPGDQIPTFLENEGLGKIGEDLVEIYDTPSITDKDPSYWVLGSFTLFFSFIVGDAGYGVIFLAIALLLYYKFPNLVGMKKRMVHLLTILGAGCLVWGVLVNSYFGIDIAYNNPLRKVSVLHWLAEKKLAYNISTQDASYNALIEKYPALTNVKNAGEFMEKATITEHGEVKYELLDSYSNEVLFELALFIAIVHLSLSFIRNLKRNWSGFGWLLFLLGSYLYFPYYLKTLSLLNYVVGIPPQIAGEAGLELIYGGIILAVLLGVAQHGLKGLHELLMVIQIFADSLSYLRLYALALAGAILSITIKEMASAVPIVIGIILVVAAHGINLVLAVMSGVIHGLRLNFLEWYHYSFEGGGYKFRALKLLKPE